MHGLHVTHACWRMQGMEYSKEHHLGSHNRRSTDAKDAENTCRRTIKRVAELIPEDAGKNTISIKQNKHFDFVHRGPLCNAIPI